MSTKTQPEIQAQGCTSLKLRQLQRTVAQLYDAEVGRCGLKTTQYSLLSHIHVLSKDRPVRPGELARAMHMDASTLTRNLRPLQAQGWVEVGEGEDARSRSVRLTPAGVAKRQEARRHWRIAQDTLNQRLGLARVAELHALIDEAQAVLDAGGCADEPDDAGSGGAA
jgi:DNA-binding MarR family transcriptional regulator